MDCKRASDDAIDQTTDREVCTTKKSATHDEEEVSVETQAEASKRRVSVWNFKRSCVRELNLSEIAETAK